MADSRYKISFIYRSNKNYVIFTHIEYRASIGVTVRYIFDTGGGAIGYVAMLEIFLFYYPMDITQAKCM